MATDVVRITGLDGVLDMLQKLPPEVVSKRGGPVKSALRRGALVLLREAKLNLARSTESLGEDDTSTGLLQKSLIASRGKPPAGEKGERYLVRVKRRAYQRQGATVTTQQTARWLEEGTEKQPAEPWMRPAFNAKKVEAVTVTTSELNKQIERIVKKLQRR